MNIIKAPPSGWTMYTTLTLQSAAVSFVFFSEMRRYTGNFSSKPNELTTPHSCLTKHLEYQRKCGTKVIKIFSIVFLSVSWDLKLERVKSG